METEEHLLALKVMRLTRPTLSSPLPLTCDGKDLPGNLLNNALHQDPTSVQGTETLCCGQFLLLPQSPVNIYLGETFSSYICVFSESQQAVKNINVKVDLQTSSQKLALSANPPTPELAPEETINIIIHHEVKEIGTHILVCEVSYTNAIGIPATFRKFFKIQVLKPLDVKTKFYNAQNDDVYLEAQVQNITMGPICLEKVALDASSMYDVISLNSTDDGENIFGSTMLVHPQSICQFLYCLTPNENVKDLKALSGPSNIGKLDIVWRSNLGEKGRLQTSQLQRMGPDYGDIRLLIKTLPNFVILEDPFNFKCELINNCDRTVDLVLSFENMEGSVAWCGISGRKLDSMPPHSTRILDFKAIPIVPGLNNISGIKLLDTFLKRTYSFDELGQIFVVIDDQKLNICP